LHVLAAARAAWLVTGERIGEKNLRMTSPVVLTKPVAWTFLGAATAALVAPTVHVARRIRPVELVGLEETAPLLPEAGAAVTGSLIASILLAMGAILLAARPNS